MRFIEKFIEKFIDKQTFETFYFYVYCLVYDFFLFGVSKLDRTRKNQHDKEKEILYDYKNYYFKENFFNMLHNINLLTIDKIVAMLIAKQYENTVYKNQMFRSYFRVLSDKKGFYLNFITLNSKNNLYYFIINLFYSLVGLI